MKLELDFYASNGSAPALCDPPEFEVGITKRYFKGKRPDEPDWFHKGTDVYQRNIGAFMAGINDHYKRMTKDHLLTAVRYPNGNSGVYRVALMLPDNRTPIFSNEAYDAYVRALVHHDDSRLEKVFGKERALKIKKRRDMDEYNVILERTKQVMRVQAVEDDDDDDEYEETE
jgi:hypothetical protein